jgi:hypothetical protein
MINESYVYFDTLNLNLNIYAGLVAEKLEWGNTDQINEILQKHPGGFDIILGADIYILMHLIPLLSYFRTKQNCLKI